MPSTIVHLAFAGLIASALLGDAFDKRSVLIVLAVTAVPDLDSFLIFWAAGHRALLHNIWIPLGAAIALWIDLNLRKTSLIKERWGWWGVRVAWVSILCYAVAHLALDLVDGVVNLFWPVHDQYYRLSGDIELSDQRGIVQTFVDGDGFLLLEPEGASSDVDITTGVDPEEGATERTFPLIGAGWELVLFLTGTVVTLARFQLADEPEK